MLTKRNIQAWCIFTDGECYTSVIPRGNVLWVLSERSNMNESLPGKIIKLEL